MPGHFQCKREEHGHVLCYSATVVWAPDSGVLYQIHHVRSCFSSSSAAFFCHTPLDSYLSVLQQSTADSIQTLCTCSETIFAGARQIPTICDGGVLTPHYGLKRGAIPRAHRSLLTLNSAQLEPSGQQILDFSDIMHTRVYLKSDQGTLDVRYDTRSNARFPAHAQGVLYYHHPNQIRFRLCRNVHQFDRGPDLLLPNGQTWSIDLINILEHRSATQRSEILDLISDNRLSLSNWHILPGRHITTLSPANFANQQIIDVSGHTLASVYTGPTGEMSRVHYHGENLGRYRPFPEGSVGVFYYKQSMFAPMHLGELRFRLCNNIPSFDHGTDLLLPSGDTWNLNSSQLLLVPRYQHIRDLLFDEGLLDCRLYPDPIRNASVVSATMSPHLFHFSQPFTVDLAQCSITLRIWVGSQFERIRNVPIFRLPKGQGGQAAYRGRAVVRLEVPPGQSLADTTSGSKGTSLFVIRFLEMLTPIERNPKCRNASYMALPETGELSMRRYYQRTFRPWAYYSQSDEVHRHFHNFKQQAPDAPVEPSILQ